MTIYAVANGKGGSTKSTTAAEVVAALTRLGRTVLALDLDRQGSLTSRLGAGRDFEVSAVAADVLTGDATVAEAAVASPTVPRAWLIAGTKDIEKIEHAPEVTAALGPQLRRQAAGWDDVVIDTPGSLGVATLAALVAADIIIAAVACEVESYDQVAELEDEIHRRVARVNAGQQLHWIIPTRYDARRNLDREVLELLGEKYPGRVTTPVHESVVVKESYIAGIPASMYSPASTVSSDYIEALHPVLTRGEH